MLAFSRTANLCVVARDHAPKARMGRTGIGRRASARAGPITLAIGGYDFTFSVPQSVSKELAIRHLFEQVSLKRELHVAGMLLRRGIARVPVAEALAWVKSDPLFVRPDPDGSLVTTREVRDAEEKMIRLAADGKGRHGALGGGKEWIIRNSLVGLSEEQTKVVHHVLGSKDFVISFKRPVGKQLKI